MSTNLSPRPKIASYARESGATRKAAGRLGIAAGSLGQYVRVRGIHLQTAALIRAAAEEGDDKLFARVTAEIYAALEARERKSWPDALAAELMADTREDRCEFEMLVDAEDAGKLRIYLARARAQFLATLDVIRAGEQRLLELEAR